MGVQDAATQLTRGGRRTELDTGTRVLLCAVAIAALLMAALGNFSPELLPDSGGYLDLPGWPGFLSWPRTPFYGWFVQALGGEGAFPAIPALQFLALSLAAIALPSAARRFGMSHDAAIALALPIPFGNAALLFTNDVHPDILAVALALGGIAFVLRICATQRTRVAAASALVGCAGLAYLLKPAFLAFCGVLPLLALLLLRSRGVSLRQAIARAAVLGLLVSSPFLAYAGLRHAVVGQFHVVSFGGIASSGLAGSMLRPETVDRLPPEHRDLARHVLGERDRLASEGKMLPIPLNSRNERSFLSTALGYFDVLARNYDNVVFAIVMPFVQPGRDWMEIDRQLQSFARAVIVAEPAHYAAWVAGATARFIGMATVLNLSFGLAAVSLVLVFLGSTMMGRLPVASPAPDPTDASRDWAPLLLVVGAWTLANYLPAVLVTFPARRYVDIAGLLLASPLVLGILRVVARSRWLGSPA
jgi:hypothetical protein